jgi:hypothetical protein
MRSRHPNIDLRSMSAPLPRTQGLAPLLALPGSTGVRDYGTSATPCINHGRISSIAISVRAKTSGLRISYPAKSLPLA